MNWVRIKINHSKSLRCLWQCFSSYNSLVSRTNSIVRCKDFNSVFHARSKSSQSGAILTVFISIVVSIIFLRFKNWVKVNGPKWTKKSGRFRKCMVDLKWTVTVWLKVNGLMLTWKVFASKLNCLRAVIEGLLKKGTVHLNVGGLIKSIQNLIGRYAFHILTKSLNFKLFC